MRITALLAVALCAPLLTASAQDDAQWRSLDVSRQLRDNGLPAHSVADYRRILHELGTKVGIQTRL